jgi:MFS family permease
MVLSNVAQIAIARAGAFTTAAHTACHTSSSFHTLSSTFTIVCGVGNCIGRVLGGYISDRVRTPSRPAWFGLFLLLMAVSQLLMACIDGVATLYATLSLCFLAYGAFWSLMPVLVAELFGERSIGTIYTIIGLAPASASFAVTVGVASTVYQAHVPPHAPPLCVQTVGMQDGKCFGLACYRDTFLITTGLCVVGAVCAFVLAARMRPFYRRIHLSSAGAAAVPPAVE